MNFLFFSLVVHATSYNSTDLCGCIVQIEYPMNIHLIRGNHEAADINALFGFRIECIERMVCAFSLPSTHVRHRLTIFSDAMMMDIHSYTNKSW